MPRIQDSDEWTGPLLETVPEWTSSACDPTLQHRVDEVLRAHGGIIVRGLSLPTTSSFRSVAHLLCGPLVDYVYRSTPRTAVSGQVYTATEYRQDAAIALHNENSYQREWPMRIAFWCVQPADKGGHTLLADTARVTARIDPEIINAFERRDVMYVRTFGNSIDLSWQVTFQTESRSVVEALCRTHGIEYRWLSEDRLRTRQRCKAMACHPVSKERLWFNQAHLFHVSNQEPDARAALINVFGIENLPRNAYFGDGGLIEDGMLENVRQAYQAETHALRLQKGDVLLLDNMLVAHGRQPFVGRRQVLVAMGTSFSPLANTGVHCGNDEAAQ